MRGDAKFRRNNGPCLAVLVIVTAAAGPAACNKRHDAAGELAPDGAAHVVAGEHGFEPSSIFVHKAAAGATAPITFVRTTERTCATEVVFPDLNIKRDLPMNQPQTVEVPIDLARTLTFQCGMGMYKGEVVVR
jgi:plastocyanin domain-containing protein